MLCQVGHNYFTFLILRNYLALTGFRLSYQLITLVRLTELIIHSITAMPPKIV
nr:MAG TPA: hypothetical protein [Bacteriophage sp.]